MPDSSPTSSEPPNVKAGCCVWCGTFLDDHIYRMPPVHTVKEDPGWFDGYRCPPNGYRKLWDTLTHL